MKKYIIIFWSVVFLSGALPAHTAPAFPKIFKYYMELGKRSLKKGDYREAIRRFSKAQLAGPHEQEPAFYINLIKRLLDDRIESKPATENLRPKARQGFRDEEDGTDLRRRPSLPRAKKLRRREISKKSVLQQVSPPKRETIEPVVSLKSSPPKTLDPIVVGEEKSKTSRLQMMDETLDQLSRQRRMTKEISEPTYQPKRVYPPPIIKEEPQDIILSKSDVLSKPRGYEPDVDTLDLPFAQESRPIVSLPPARMVVDAPPTISTPRTAIESKTPRYILTPTKYLVDETQNIIFLNNDLWQEQPGTLIRIELGKNVILETSNYRRHLIITPGFIDIEQINKDQIMVTSKKRGSTFLHIWDDTGRWTFKMEVILPIRETSVELLEDQVETYAKPFKLTYSSDWSSFYKGPSLNEVERENLNFLQRILLEGETPYGDFDSHVIFNKFDASTEVTGYGVGLTDGTIGDFKDFSIRGFDIQKVFSPLSLPGQYVRGVLFEAEAFDNQVKYTFLHGRDRQVFGFLSPDVSNEEESFVQGARVTLFPHQENQFSLNYVHGYGDARESFLNDTVFSIEGQRRIQDVLVKGEYAYDETSTAMTASSRYETENHDITLNVRDIESAFTTATSLPGNRGEVGGTIFWNWSLNDVNINTYLDLYRERFLPNPEAEDTINVDFNTTIDIPLSKTDRVRTSIYYVDTTGELSPRNNVRSNVIYTKYFKFGERNVTAFAGINHQRSRFDESPSSEFDRYSLSTGVTVPLIKSLNYYINYEYSWLYDEQSGDIFTPNVMNTGLNYTKKLFDHWTFDSSFSYRNEENTRGNNSFLAGEDNITGSIGATYRPNDDMEFFIDGRTRNVWAEEVDREAFNEIDVRVGIRTAWGTPWTWNPKGKIAGFVYKDLNGNQVKEEGEDGIADVTIDVGKKTVKTNKDGYYKSTVKAKTAQVSVNINSVPDGFVFSTPAIVDVDIIPHKTHSVHFGLTSRSGIYGVVYFDKNKNGKPDSGDEFISGAKMILDGKKTAVSDFEGTYFFEGIKPGVHEVALDVNSFPIEYLPTIKLKNVIDVSEGTTYKFHILLDKINQKK